MLKSMEATGRSEDAAVKNALMELGLDRDSVSVEVLERARSGFLGFGSAPAKVKITYEVPDEIAEPVPAQEAPRPTSPVEQKKKESKKSKEVVAKEAVEQGTPVVQAPPVVPSAPTEAAPAKAGDVEERIRDFLSGLLERMDVKATMTITSKTESGVHVILEGEKLGAIIGHRGETLDAIQQLTNYAVNRSRAHRVRIHIDAENYRAKREDSLKHLAEKVATKVIKYRRNITLEPMNAYERHVIHEALQDYPNVITYSTGTEPNRRTVVAFSRGKHTY